MSATKRLHTRTFGSQPELIRMRELELEDASWVLLPVFAWTAIEIKASLALMHRNLVDFDLNSVNGYQLAEFLDDTFDSCWRRAPVYDAAILRNQLEALKRQIDRGYWAVLGWWEERMVEWVEDAQLPEGGRWQLRPKARYAENGSALLSRLEQVSRQRRLKAGGASTPLAGEPFRAQFGEPLPGVPVAGTDPGSSLSAWKAAQQIASDGLNFGKGLANTPIQLSNGVQR
ncbi:hypothetical protein [Trinickia mobilis]|uniref:hypothetical protein n=1 Tax=Trinickia mobilis TaxID=2816356 RepID=UPI001A8D78E6|nr:hypothetical protein [Trinickia mobilis]